MIRSPNSSPAFSGADMLWFSGDGLHIGTFHVEPSAEQATAGVAARAFASQSDLAGRIKVRFIEAIVK